jgi:predicted O-methyltransferase YrrM
MIEQSPPDPTRIQEYFGAIYPAYAMLAGLQLDIFSTLKDRSKSSQDIADDLQIDAKKLRILLQALVAADLLSLSEGKFENTEESNFYLVKDSPAYVGGGHPFVAWLWEKIPHTAETVRTGLPQAPHDWYEETTPEMMPITDAYHKGSLTSADALLSQFDLSEHRHIADIGGGTGALAISLTDALPRLEITIIDLKAAILLAEDYINPVPQKDRIHLQVHDMVKDPLTASFDGAIMSSFTQVLSSEQNQQALQHTFDMLEPSGCLYIMAAVLNDDTVSPKGTTLGNLILMNIYDGGQAFTESEYREWLTNAGFVDIERIQDTGIIRAVKPV